MRNGFVTRHHPWATVHDVQFGEGDPWAYLVTDGDEEDDKKAHFMLAIQRSEGPSAHEHVRQLREAVHAHRVD